MLNLDDKKFLTQFIKDCKHMIDARKVQYEDMTNDLVYVTFLMDNYDEKDCYLGMACGSLYYKNEDLIHFILNKYFHKIFKRI